MHGHSPGSALLANAEVDSMGGVIDSGVGNDNKTSPRRAAIEKAQAELRQEYDVREERRRELEFLEKGGNPLDFKHRPATSISVQSTSLTDQLAEQFVTSEAKGSFALAASPHGDSVESSGRPGAPACREPNSADNLLLFDGENDLDGERNSKHPRRRNNITPSEQSSQLDGNTNAKESEDSVIFRLVKSQAYARRNRSRSSRDSARACSTDLVPAADGNGSSSLPSACHGSRDGKGSVYEAKAQKDHIVSSICNSKSTNPNGNVVFKTLASDNQVDMELDAVHAHKVATGLTESSLPEGPEVTASRDLRDGKDDQHLLLDDEKDPNITASVAPDFDGEREEGVSSGLDCMSCEATEKAENVSSVGELNEFSIPNRGGKDMQNEDQNRTQTFAPKGPGLESCTQISHSLDGLTASDRYLNKANVNGNVLEQTFVFEGTPDIVDVDLVKQSSETEAVDAVAVANGDPNPVQPNLSSNGSQVKIEEEICDSRTGLENEGKPLTRDGGTEPNDHIVSNTERKLDDPLGDNSSSKKAGLCPQDKPSSTTASFNCELPKATFSGEGSTAAAEIQTCKGNDLKLVSKADEDSILEEARTIEAKRKRIAELSVGNVPSENRRKSHWDFVLEEMAWLANDFMQERLWKTTAAAQIGHWVSFTSRFRLNEQNQCWKQRNVAHTLAKAIMQFWLSAEVLLNSDDSTVGPKECKAALVGSRKETSKHLEEQTPGQSRRPAVKGYAMRFLKYNRSLDHLLQAEAPVTPDRISDMSILEMSWEDKFSEESLFYSVLPGAMECYRKSVESYWEQFEKTSGSLEEVETSMYDTVPEYGSRENAYEEEEGETGAYYSPRNFEVRNTSKFSQKKRKHLPKSYTARSYEVGADLPYGHCMENRPATQPSLLMGKRPPNSLTVGSIPTKRMRTATRQRVLSPFSAGATGAVQGVNKTDVSSEDTSSFQDDQSILHGGSQFRKALEVESTRDFGKPLPFDCTEISTKPKKKKAKHLLHKNSMNSTDTGAFVIPGKGSAYEQRWQLDSTVQNEQRNHSKKRLEGHHFESNGSSGLFGQHALKKPKIMKQIADASPETLTPVIGSIPSPVASQMSNMSNPNKLIKMISGRDRGRKSKALKVPAGQSGSGSPWSLFEDQALVVLVHDMGPNWELVSDAINSTLQFKCIFRKPKECKERHKILMDRNGGDGADSAEDSGSSQPYPSTLRGIPKGSARQLFQRLQGPMEEETLKSHFEKIILIGKQQHSRRNQNDIQELKQKVPVHNSHFVALSQVFPNNLNGGLTPLDLCDATTPSPDNLSLGHQVSHNSGLAIANQGSVTPVLPTSGANTMLQGSSSMVLGNSLPLPSAVLNAPTRDGQRYGVSRPASLPIDEQQRMQHYNQMLSGRNIQQGGLSVPGAMSGNDRGVRMLSGGNGMGVMCGMNRGMPMPRPGFQGIGSPAMLNSGTMLSSSGVGPVNMRSGAVSSQGNSMLGARDAMHLMRPGQNPEDQRQMMMQELQMQVTHGNSQGIPPFNGLSTAFSNQTIPPPVQTFPVQHQQQHQMPMQQAHVLSNPHHSLLQGNNHATSPQQQQQAYVLRVAKEKQLQQRFLHQQQMQQHQFAASNALMPQAQPQAQHPISSSVQSSPQIHQQVSSQSVSLPPPNSQYPLTPSSPMNPITSQPQQKQNHLLPHGHSRNPQAGGSSMPNQMMKQRQRQPQQQLQQPGRYHPQQRQQSHSQQQAKIMKGLDRGNMIMHQNLAIDPSHVNGLPTTPGSQVTENGEQVMHLTQGQGLFPGSGSNSIQPGKPLLPQSSNHSQPQQKLFSRAAPPSLKQLSQMPSHSDNSNQGPVPPVSSGHLSASQQPMPPLAMAASHQSQHSQPQQRQVGQPPHNIQRMLQLNRQMNSDPPMQSPVDRIPISQQPVNSAFQMGTTTTMPQSCSESTSAIPVVSSTSASQWKAPEPLYDAGSSNPPTNLAAIGNPPVPNTVGSEPMPLPSHGLVQRQYSGSMTIRGHNIGVQWPQLPQQQQQASSSQQKTQQTEQQQPSPSQQQQQQPSQQQQQPQPQQPLQEQQHLPAGKGGPYTRPTISGPG